ncbi:MAG: PAS domain-containing protein [Acidobacteria bacterium]|nr:PAS domain-containing protein [Acidobacteriota bacterium]MCI0720452.1 PAS domain-containing protein [Acidobacteriota bacterium]
MDEFRKCELTDVELTDSIPIVKAVMNAIEALVIVVDLEGRIVLFNRMCQESTGYSFQEAKGMPFWKLLLPEELEQVKAAFQLLKSGDFPGQHVNHWVAKDGTRRRIRWSNSAVLDASGSVKYLIGTGIDIT